MIDLIPSAEQQDVADSIAKFLAEEFPPERLHHRNSPGFGRDGDKWQALAALGCFGLSLPESDGGVGMGLAEEVLAFREYGRALVTPAILGSVLGARIAARSAPALLPALLQGQCRVGIAVPLDAAVGERCDGGFQLLASDGSDHVVAWTDQGMALLQMSAFSECTDGACIDESLHMANGRVIDAKPLAFVADEALPLLASVLGAAMLAGSIEAVRDMAVSHAGSRLQFGRPVGSFQAVKHRCVDMALGAEKTWSQVAYAALALQAGLPDAAFQVATAKAVAIEAALHASRTNVQLHGAMGFTAEIGAHRHVKRAHVLAEIGGNLRHQQRRLLEPLSNRAAISMERELV